jgi:hypothetical protein
MGLLELKGFRAYRGWIGTQRSLFRTTADWDGPLISSTTPPFPDRLEGTVQLLTNLPQAHAIDFLLLDNLSFGMG